MRRLFYKLTLLLIGSVLPIVAGCKLMDILYPIRTFYGVQMP